MRSHSICIIANPNRGLGIGWPKFAAGTPQLTSPAQTATHATSHDPHHATPPHPTPKNTISITTTATHLIIDGCVAAHGTVSLHGRGESTSRRQPQCHPAAAGHKKRGARRHRGTVGRRTRVSCVLTRAVKWKGAGVRSNENDAGEASSFSFPSRVLACGPFPGQWRRHGLLAARHCQHGHAGRAYLFMSPRLWNLIIPGRIMNSFRGYLTLTLYMQL